MKIFQPIISGSFTTSGSVFLKGLTSAAQSNVVIIDTATGQLYTTASSALGGGGGGGSTFPYTGSAQITGSLEITGSLYISGSVTGSNIRATSAIVAPTITYSSTLSTNGGEMRLAQSTVRLNNSSTIQWSDTSDSNHTRNIGLRRYTTGTLEVYDGTTNTGLEENRRDLLARTLSGSSLYISGSSTMSGSLNVTQGITGSLFGTASYATNALTASYVIGGDAAFPYTGTAVITGSLVVTSTLQLDGSLTDFATVNSTIVGANNLYTRATGSYTSAFVKYTVSKGTNSRAGEFITNWNGTTVTYFDNSTTDIGSTSDIVFSSAIVSSEIQVNATAATSGWKLKTLATFI